MQPQINSASTRSTIWRGSETTVKAVLDARRDLAPFVRAIAVDTTASTPALADEHLTPLAMHDRYKDNPNAMFVLWKDHTGEQEAAEINRACAESATNYSKFTGYHYSSECFWSKVLHLLRADEQVRRDAYTVVECCDWIPAILTGNTSPEKAKMGHCCAGQKMFWSEEWGGFPPREFFERIDPDAAADSRHAASRQIYLQQALRHHLERVGSEIRTSRERDNRRRQRRFASGCNRRGRSL